MPVIRYRTRDLTRLLPPTSRSMRRIGKITGRSDDMLIVRGVNLFPTQVEEVVLRMPELAAQYQLVLTRSGNLDELEILTEVRPEFDHLTIAERDALAGKLKHRSEEHKSEIQSQMSISYAVTCMKKKTHERTIN